MKKIVVSICLIIAICCSMAIPIYAATSGAVYTLPVLNSCGFYGTNKLVRGTFSVNGVVDHTQTSFYYIAPGFDDDGYYHNGGYIYIYKTTTGQIYVPYDDGYTDKITTDFTSSCNTMFHY